MHQLYYWLYDKAQYNI